MKALSSHPAARRSFRSERGSVLIVALIFAAIIALSIGSFVRVGQNNLQISSRAFYNNAAINLAESGLEQAIWSINQLAADATYDWSADGWSTDASTAWQKFTGFQFDQNTTGYVRVHVQNRSGSPAPVLVARATIQPPNGAQPIEKWIEVRLSKRSLFANGLVAKDWITFSGNGASVDSYDSRKGSYNAILPDGSRNRYARGSAGSGSIIVDSFNLGNADIWGYVSIGSPDYSGLDVGPNGTVAGFGSSQGTVDYSRVTTDFKPNFEDAEAPTVSPYTIAAITNDTDLPLAGHTPAADGKYYYSTSSIALSGNHKNLLITPGKSVVLTVTTNSGTAISISGQANIEVPATAALSIYTAGNVAIAGNGVANSNDPVAFQLYSTRSSSASGTQSISISGNGQLSAVVYAPNASLSMNGGGSSGNVFGAAVAKTVTVTGGSAFHYDESLADMTDGNPFGIASWHELTSAAERSTRTARVSFN